MTDVRYLLYKDYESGLNNNLMSVELAVGLAHLTGRTLVYYGTLGEDRQLIRCRGGHYHKVPESRAHLIDNERNPTILDLLEPLPVPTLTYAEFLGKTRDNPSLSTRNSDIALGDAVFTREPLPVDHGTLLDFAEGKTIFHDTGEDILHLHRMTLGHYSRLFYDPTPELHATLEKIQPKQIYRDLAAQVAATLAPFNAVHIRLTDFRTFLPQDQSTYPATILENLRALFPTTERLLIATDEPENKTFFTGITDTFPDHLFLEDHLLKEHPDAIRALPFTDETTFGLLANLILQHAHNFAGTPGSSFTGIIQRAILRRKNHTTPNDLDLDTAFQFISSSFPASTVPFQDGRYQPSAPGPYSWNRVRLPCPVETRSWFRDWPESVLPGAPAPKKNIKPHTTAPKKSPDRSAAATQKFLADKPLIWLASYPRSGNTFLRIILRQCFGLRSASLYPNDLGANRRLEDLAGHIEHARPSRIPLPNDGFQFVKTHEPLPDDKPAIYLLRHGWDANRSLHEFYGRQQSLTHYLDGHHRFGPWSDHLKNWNPQERPNTLLLKYEDLVANPAQTLDHLAHFLKTPILSNRIPTRNEVANIDGTWVRKKSKTPQPNPNPDLHKKFLTQNKDALTKAGYV